MNYYNDSEPFVCAWLRNLIAAKLIPPGDVDERSITEIQPDDLRGYDQVHFFAGIGGWAYALRLAGWEGPVWTGSCPCQPFSSAGKAAGVLDERHLWPAFRRLIAECRPATVFGEQVASKAGREWLAGIRLDLEDLGYAVGAADLCAAGVGAPHIRQRLYWVADGTRRGTRSISAERRKAESDADRGRKRLPSAARMAHTGHEQTRGSSRPGCAQGSGTRGEPSGPSARLEHSQNSGLGRYARDGGYGSQSGRLSAQPLGSASDAGWRNAAIINGRRVKPGIRLLVDGVPNRVGTLRGFGNAIVPSLAAEFVRAYIETMY